MKKFLQALIAWFSPSNLNENDVEYYANRPRTKSDSKYKTPDVKPSNSSQEVKLEEFVAKLKKIASA